MLAKKHRLSKEQFDSYFKLAKRRNSPNLQLLIAADDGFHGAVVVGKKVFKQAVKRNALRRSLYGVLYRHRQQAPITGTFILIAKASAKSLSRRELLTEAKVLLEGVV